MTPIVRSGRDGQLRFTQQTPRTAPAAVWSLQAFPEGYWHVRSQPGCAVGRSRISFSVIRRGRVTANAMTSATSSAVMASCA